MTQNFENEFSVLYENDSTSNYLVLKTGINNTIINYQVQMLLNNKLNGLLPFNVNYIEDDINCFYNVTSKCSLASFMSRKLFSRDEFLIAMLNIINNIYQLKNFLLYENNILLDENFIYVEPESIDIYFVYLPFLNRENDIKAFFIKLIFKLVKFKEEYSDNYIQKILETIKNDNFSLSSLKSVIEKLLGEEIKNRTTNSMATESSFNNEEKEIAQKSNKLENASALQANSGLSKNNKLSLDKLGISKLKADKTKAEKSKLDKTKDAITKLDKPTITNGNFRIPNSPSIENQKRKNKNLVTQTKDDIADHTNEKVEQNKKVKLLLFAAIVFQPFLLVTFIVAVNSSFVKMSDNPINTGVILLLIVLLIDVLVIRMLNEKRKKTDETSTCKPLQFINDKMKNRAKPGNAELLSYSNDKQENDIPIVNEGYNGETVIIKRPKLPEKPYLKEKDGEGVIEINKNSILIGRMENFVDFVINSNAIGKIHAEIIQEGEDYFIMDCNSRNGTFLNDNRIVPNTKNKVSNNDLLRFANKEFIFLYSLI